MAFTPTALGEALVSGYRDMGLSNLWKPDLRASIERNITLVAQNRRTKAASPCAAIGPASQPPAHFHRWPASHCSASRASRALWSLTLPSRPDERRTAWRQSRFGMSGLWTEKENVRHFVHVCRGSVLAQAML